MGAALVLAVVTAAVAGDGPAVDFGRYRPGVTVVSGVALAGLAFSITALLSRRRDRVAAA